MSYMPDPLWEVDITSPNGDRDTYVLITLKVSKGATLLQAAEALTAFATHRAEIEEKSRSRVRGLWGRHR